MTRKIPTTGINHMKVSMLTCFQGTKDTTSNVEITITIFRFIKKYAYGSTAKVTYELTKKFLVPITILNNVNISALMIIFLMLRIFIFIIFNNFGLL